MRDQERLLLRLLRVCGNSKIIPHFVVNRKAWVARIECVAMAAMYASLIIKLAQSEFFMLFFIRRINYGTPGDSPHHDGMARHMSSA